MRFLDKWLPRLWGVLLVIAITAAVIALDAILIKWMLTSLGVM